MVGEYNWVSGSQTKQYLETNRPWLSLYGTRIRPVNPVGSTSGQSVHEPSLLHRVLPDEILHEIFLRMTATSLGRAACVCRKWLFATRNPSLWRSACFKAWQNLGIPENERVVHKSYGGSWRRMWVQRPRLRFDGLYVSRNTYIRAGIAEWRTTNPVHLVCYYRYLRFFSSGKFLYKTSPLHVKEVARIMRGRVSRGDAVYGGQFTLTSNQVDAAIVYPGVNPTMLRLRLRLRGTVPGANNRLDVLLLMTTGVGEEEDEENVMDLIDGWQDNETHNPDVPAISHRRGLASFVFVPFDEVETSILNLPVEKMDYYVPG